MADHDVARERPTFSTFWKKSKEAIGGKKITFVSANESAAGAVAGTSPCFVLALLCHPLFSQHRRGQILRLFPHIKTLAVVRSTHAHASLLSGPGFPPTPPKICHLAGPPSTSVSRTDPIGWSSAAPRDAWGGLACCRQLLRYTTSLGFLMESLGTGGQMRSWEGLHLAFKATMRSRVLESHLPDH